MKRHSLLALLALVALVLGSLALSACGSSSSSSTPEKNTTATESESTAETATAETEESESSSSSSSGEGGKVGLLLDVARNDKSFGQAEYEGAKEAAEELGLELSVVDNVAENAQKAQSALLNFAKEDDYVINNAVAMMGGLPRIAEQYPEKQFGALSVEVESKENLHWAFQDWYPLGYLAGVAAAEETKSDVVAYVGGGEIPPTIAGQAGFDAGVKAVNPKAEVLSTITGSFEDTTKAKDAASSEISQGADVIYAFLDAAHLGVVQAAKEAGGVKIMGIVVPKCSYSDGLDIGDTVVRQDLITGNLLRAMAKGEAENIVYGVQDPKIASLAFCPGGGTPAVKKAVEAAREEFASGKLKTPGKYLKIESGQE